MRRSLLSLDVTSVLVFVGMGRATHESGSSFSGYVETAAPFLIGLLVGWLAMRVWRDPLGLVTGAGVVAYTVTVGMVLRSYIWDGGTAFSFVLVATAFLTLLLIGWRLVAKRFA